AIQEVQSPGSQVQSPAASGGYRVSSLEEQQSGRATPVTRHSSLVTSPKPILVKVAPDLSFEALDEILELAGPRNIAGIVATKTTITRPETRDPDLKRLYAEAGGLSGRPLRARSTEIVRHLYRQTKGSLPII